ncbi:MAG: ABC transporter ATP-binding protein [Pirellulaceae bacterium]|nr:ABC transporter ATP-binding protein [Pirellulaceae bacterium]MDP7020154.1 ABC transporter ATP-binding protein [Pirellulaceae bacterium]
MIQIKDVTIEVGKFRVDRASLTVPTGAYGVMMGPTGSGKTTILEAIAGLRRIKSGRIVLDSRDVTALKPAERAVGYVPQDGALFRTMNVAEHLAFALTIRRRASSEISGRVKELAKLLNISHLLERSIVGLSGGEQQRVSLGRALSFSPRTLLLDEPLSALDDETRDQMYGLLKRVQEQTGVTALHVTHSLEEARRLGDCHFRFSGGEEQRDGKTIYVGRVETIEIDEPEVEFSAPESAPSES